MRIFVGIDIEPEIRERIARFVEGARGFHGALQLAPRKLKLEPIS